MKTTLRIALAQIHLRVGVDTKTLNYNISQMRNAYERACDESCDVVVFPELALTGYSPEDLLLRFDVQQAFSQAGDQFRDEILNRESGPVIIFGAPRMVNPDDDGNFPQELESRSTLDISGPALANAAIVVDPVNSTSREIYKSHLPNWGVFDEARWFASARCLADPIEISGVVSGVAICRDIWKESTVAGLVKAGARVIYVPNASPYANSRISERIRSLRFNAQKYGVPIVYVNMIEGCDEAVFDGGSFIVNANGDLVAQTMRFEEDFIAIDLEISEEKPMKNIDNSLVEGLIDLSASLGHDIFDPHETYRAIVLGTREFINSISPDVKVVIGLSGGIDSALVATVAVDALGASRVHGVLLPSKYTSDRSNADAELLAKSLGIGCETISIEKMHEVASIEFSLDSLPSIVSENIQSRLRGLSLMKLSNSQGYLVLATSNKSESAVGYCTLYGDTVGAYSPIKDVYKTQVYELCSWRNMTELFEVHAPIPDSIIDREPTAELRENQTDESSLYPYEVLDGILERFIDHDLSIEAIVADGFDQEIVEHVVSLVKASEFKRKQTPIGPRLTRKNFGKGRRVPISAHW